MLTGRSARAFKTAVTGAAAIGASSIAIAQADGGIAIPPGEAQDIETVVATGEAIVNAAAKAGEKPVLRDAHAKGHGCVHASFKVRANLPAELRQGVFTRPADYPAWIRFSNGNGAPQDDHAGDGRGMAIKLIGLAGTKLLADEMNATTQDFVMINYPVFFIRNVADYVPFVRLSATHRTDEFFASHPHEKAISNAITSNTVDRVFEQSYFSMAPYRLGPRFMKFRTQPVDCRTGAAIRPSTAAPPAVDPNYLREDMIKWLSTAPACFVFGIQLQTDPGNMPIEDPTILWDEVKSPFVPVADIRIPAQQFASDAQQAYCENLSFTPWHALAAQEPVGGINRLRRAIYEAISKLRHQLNGAVRAEPTTVETFN